MAYAQMGMYPEALAAVEKGSSHPEVADYGFVGWVHARAGRKAEAQRLLRRLEEPSRRHVGPGAIAIIYIGLGQKEQALTWLERAYEERSWSLSLLKVHPVYDPLRDDPRFPELLARMNFPD